MNNANIPAGHDTTEDAREIHPSVITWALVIGLVVAFVVTASSFKLSFTTLLDLGRMAGLRDSAWVVPVVLDGPILAASILRIALSQHKDRTTVLGRRFIVAVFALAGIASMAGNAYHAVLTVTDLNAAVAAVIGALAPLMVMTMGEMMSIAISAPRRRIVAETAVAHDATQALAGDTAAFKPVDLDETEPTATASAIDEDLDNGLLKPAVWKSVDVYLTQPQWNLSDIARHLDLHTSTVSRHIKTWTQVQQQIASERSTTTLDQPSPTVDHGHDDSDGAAQSSAGYRVDDEYGAVDADRDYVGASR